jgi:hypothetical protein
MKRSRLRFWLIALAVIGVLGLGIWQWGTYGPFEVTVNTPGSNLEQVVVRLNRFTRSWTIHGVRVTYSETRVGWSNEPIIFPRKFVCFCLTPPVLTYAASHPTFFFFNGTVPTRRFGISRSEPGRMVLLRDHANSGSQLAPILNSYMYDIEHEYVPHVQLPQSRIGEYMQQVRDEISALPLAENQKAHYLQQVGTIEASLRERAQH